MMRLGIRVGVGVGIYFTRAKMDFAQLGLSLTEVSLIEFFDSDGTYSQIYTVLQ